MSRLLFTLMLTVVGYSGCGRSEMADTAVSQEAAQSSPSSFGRRMYESKTAAVPAMEADMAAEPPAAPGATQAANMSAVEQSRPDRYLIKNGMMSVEVDDARVAAQQASTVAVGVGGYTANRNESLPLYGPRDITMQLRVPATQFDPVMEQLAGLGKVMQQSVQTEEVTEEFVDTDARVRNLKQTEERLIGHLQSSTNLEEILALERELTRVREEIERMEGRLRFLTSRIDFSTISLTLKEKPKAEPMTPVQAWSFGNELSDAVRSLLVFLQGLLALGIWLLVWAVVWLPILLVLWLIVRRLRRRVTPPPTPEVVVKNVPRED